MTSGSLEVQCHRWGCLGDLRSLKDRGAPLEVQRDESCSAEWAWTLETHKEAEVPLQTVVSKDYEDHIHRWRCMGSWLRLKDLQV